MQSCPEVHESKTLEEVRPEGRAGEWRWVRGVEVGQGSDYSMEHLR